MHALQRPQARATLSPYQHRCILEFWKAVLQQHVILNDINCRCVSSDQLISGVKYLVPQLRGATRERYMCPSLNESTAALGSIQAPSKLEL